jgi:hypothetical protein
MGIESTLTFAKAATAAAALDLPFAAVDSCSRIRRCPSVNCGKQGVEGVPVRACCLPKLTLGGTLKPNALPALARSKVLTSKI